MTKVLVIDDEQIIRERLKNLLELDGYKTFMAEDGQRGLEAFGRENPEIVLVDIKMPGIDGIEVLKKIKVTSKETEVIIITGHGSISNAVQALNEGAFAYIQKPIEYDELAINIKKALEKQKMQKKLVNNEERYHDLFENANDLIQIADREGRFLDVNKKWLEVLEYPKEEVEKLTVWDILRQDQVPHCQELFQKVLSGQAIEKVETIFVSKSRKEIYVEGSVSARFEGDQFISTRGIFRNITERKKAEEGLGQKVSELERFNQAAVGRELKMVELKKEIEQLKSKLAEQEEARVNFGFPEEKKGATFEERQVVKAVQQAKAEMKIDNDHE